MQRNCKGVVRQMHTTLYLKQEIKKIRQKSRRNKKGRRE